MSPRLWRTALGCSSPQGRLRSCGNQQQRQVVVARWWHLRPPASAASTGTAGAEPLGQTGTGSPFCGVGHAGDAGSPSPQPRDPRAAGSLQSRTILSGPPRTRAPLPALPCPAPLCCEPRPRSAAIKPRCIYSIRPPRSSLLLPLLPSFLARPSFSQSSRCFLLYLSCFSAGSVSGEGWEMNV